MLRVLPDEERVSRIFGAWARETNTIRPRAATGGLAGLLELAIGLHLLPVVRLRVPEEGDGRAIRVWLRHGRVHRVLLRGVHAVLEVPGSRGEYVEGHDRRRLRQSLRYGERAGLRARTVDTGAERAALLALADRVEREQAGLDRPFEESANADLDGLALWVVVETPDPRPVLLAVLAVAGEVGVLRYYRRLADDDDASLARFVAMPFLLERLRERGVRHLADTGRPHRLPDNLRVFQRKLGFRLTRIRVR